MSPGKFVSSKLNQSILRDPFTTANTRRFAAHSGNCAHFPGLGIRKFKWAIEQIEHIRA